MALLEETTATMSARTEVQTRLRASPATTSPMCLTAKPISNGAIAATRAGCGARGVVLSAALAGRDSAQSSEIEHEVLRRQAELTGARECAQAPPVYVRQRTHRPAQPCRPSHFGRLLRKSLIYGGRYWDRTSDPCRVKAVLYR